MSGKSKGSGSDIPLGLGMAFAQNTDAMEYFSSLSKTRQQQIIDKAHSIGSSQEMQALVKNLGEKNDVF
ncbi:MAG: hypothetical protein GX051_06815 [Clostridiales bacterium]|nr:hypothetical protein [Clostridiales bacterium]